MRLAPESTSLASRRFTIRAGACGVLLSVLLLGLAACAPAPQMASPKPAGDCSIPGGPPGAAPPPNWNGVTGGKFEAATITIPSSATIQLASDLVIIADKDLIVSGAIKFPRSSVPGPPSPNITLVSRNGRVRITGGADIGGGYAAPGAPSTVVARPAFAQSGPGNNGGLIKIIGVNIDARGEIVGHGGGDGGDADANSQAAPLGWLDFFHRATAVSGQGGFGGDVWLCAIDSINMGGALAGLAVSGGQGGRGGDAFATSDLGWRALAVGGPGNDGGDVVVNGTFQGAPVQVFINQPPQGGDGQRGGDVVASGGGGNAVAEGGKGGKGGTVKFDNAIVMNQGTAAAGSGGRGGIADAGGGAGGNGFFFGGGGGDATTTGGDGGAEGGAPMLPLPVGGPRPGRPGTNGSGGDAYATAGDGGNATVDGGGSSGTSRAQGGSNGASVSPGPPVTKGPIAPTGATGGVAVPATQFGAP